MKYKIKVKTVTGMFAQFDGHIEFYSNFDLDRDGVIDRAVKELKHGAYSCYTKSMLKFGDFTVE